MSQFRVGKETITIPGEVVDLIRSHIQQFHKFQDILLKEKKRLSQRARMNLDRFTAFVQSQDIPPSLNPKIRKTKGAAVSLSQKAFFRFAVRMEAYERLLSEAKEEVAKDETPTSVRKAYEALIGYLDSQETGTKKKADIVDAEYCCYLEYELGTLACIDYNTFKAWAWTKCIAQAAAMKNGWSYVTGTILDGECSSYGCGESGDDDGQSGGAW